MNKWLQRKKMQNKKTKLNVLQTWQKFKQQFKYVDK